MRRPEDLTPGDLGATMTKEVVDFKKKLTDEKRSGIVLDIDETLAWTVGHWFKEMQTLFGNPENLTPEQMIAKYKYAQHVPYWQTPEASLWMEDARSNDALHEILPVFEDASEAVRQIGEIVPVVGYLTIRPRTVVNGTRIWLQNHGFPEAEILARPTYIPTERGNGWKADVLHYLYPQVQGIVDDSPSVAAQLSPDYQGTLYQYDSVGEGSVAPRIIPCKTWADVRAQIQQDHPTS